MICKYRKKPVEVEAVQFTGDNVNEILQFALGSYPAVEESVVLIPNIHGTMFVSNGDYVIQENNGDYTVCKPDIFEDAYEYVVIVS